MSGLLAGKVWQSNLESHLKPLAAAMADIANDDGTSIFPSVAYLAWLLGKGDRSVQQGLSELRSLGVIEPVAFEKGGRNHPTEYRLIEDRLPYRLPWKELRKGATSAPFPNQRMKQGSPIKSVKGAVSDIKGCTSEQERVQIPTERVKCTAPDPSVEPLVDTSIEPSAPFSSEPFTLALVAFEAHRKEIRKPLKPTGRKALYSQLAKLSETEATSELWRSIERGWTGVFPKDEKRVSPDAPFGYDKIGRKILSDDGKCYTFMGEDGTPTKRWHNFEAFCAEKGIDPVTQKRIGKVERNGTHG